VKRLVGVLLLLLFGVALVAACKSSSSGDATQSNRTTALIRGAAAKTAAAPWMQFRQTSTSNDGVLTVDETSNPSETVARGATKAGQSSVPFAALDGVYYVDTSTSPSAKLQSGKRWLSIDQTLVPSTARRAVADRLALLSFIQPDVQKLHRQKVNGVSSEGYRIQLRTSDFVRHTGLAGAFDNTVATAAGADALKDAYKQLGVKDATGFYDKLYGDYVTADVYIGEGMVRRMTMSMSPKAGVLTKVPQMRHVAESLAAKTQFDLLGLPAKLEVAKPDSSQVQTVSSFDDYVAALNGTNSAN
jgi:hypothetical protein